MGPSCPTVPHVPLTAAGFFIVTANHHVKLLEGYRSGHIIRKHLHVKVKNKSSKRHQTFGADSALQSCGVDSLLWKSFNFCSGNSLGVRYCST